MTCKTARNRNTPEYSETVARRAMRRVRMLLTKLIRQRTVVDPNTPSRWIYRWQRTSQIVIKSARRTLIPGKLTPDRTETAVGGYQVLLVQPRTRGPGTLERQRPLCPVVALSAHLWLFSPSPTRITIATLGDGRGRTGRPMSQL